MQIDTKHFGVLEVDEKGIINFPLGVPGFENVNKFVLLTNIENDSLFHWLQGVDNTQLAFAIINPFMIKSDYVVDVDDSEVEMLEIKDIKKVLVYSIVVVTEDVSKMTLNLKAPILINTENNKAKQVINENEEYRIKHFLMEELSQAEAGVKK